MIEKNDGFDRRSVAGTLLMAASGLLSAPILAQSGSGNRPPPPGAGPGFRPPAPPPPYIFESATGPNGQCILIPQETEGPYPVDFVNNAKMHRIDIREGKPGIPLDLEMNFVDVRVGCRPIRNARIDIWQCDSEGIYSAVQNLALVPGARHDDMRNQTFLRGIQNTDAKGRVRFRTIYPGWYPSRITHIHFQVRLSDGRVVTSQIAFPEDVTRAVYDSPIYRDHGQNNVVKSLADDNVFGDDLGKYQMITLTGDLKRGFKGRLEVAVAAS